MLKNKTFTISDDNGVELLVNADVDTSSDYNEYGDYEQSAVIDIKSVELIIAKKGVIITDNLDKKQLKSIENEIISQLTIAA